MKYIVIPIALCTLMGCKSSQPMHHVARDTHYYHNQQYDSVYIYHDRTTNHGKDTIFIKDVSIEYRYRLLRDTVRIVQCDSIPYPVTVVQTQEVKYIPWWCKVLAWIGGFSLILWTVRRFIRKYL